VTQQFARTLILAGAVLGAAVAPAAAQDVPFPSARSLVPAVFPRWDAGGSLGFLAVTTSDIGSSWRGWEQKADYRVDVGRYWTTHLKTEVAVSASNQWDAFESVDYPVPGIPGRTFAYIDAERQLFAIAPAGTWQFRENSLMHPFVSGGVKLGMLQEQRFRAGGTYRSGPGAGSASYTVTPLDEQRTTVSARPFVAAGFKSYLSRAVFVRTEGRLAFASDGVRQVTAGVGLGFDF